MSPAIPGSPTRPPATDHGLKQPRRLRSRRPPSVRAASAALTVVFTASACGGSHVNAQTGPVATTSSTAVTSPSKAPRDNTPRQRAEADVAAQVRKYEQVLDEVSTHRKSSLTLLSSVSTAPDLADETGSINRLREARDRVTGHSRVTGMRVDRLSLLAQAGRHGALPTARVTLCLNVADVHAIDQRGHSIVPKSRKPYFLTHLTLINRSYPTASGWLVSKVTDREVNQCAV